MVFNTLIKTLPFLVPFAALALAETSQESGLVFSGVSQNDVDAVQTIDRSKPVADQFDVAGANLLTLNMHNAKATVVKIDASVDFWLLLGAYADAYRKADSSEASLVLQSQSAAFVADIRKLYGSLYLPWADISVGRQIISFGEGLVFSPIDVFSSVNILDLSLRRSGSDVARVRVPFGELTGVDAIAKVNSRSQGIDAAIKGYGHAGSFDIAGVGIYQGGKNEFITGLTFKGDLVAGVYGELVEHWRYAGYRAFVGMLGADYSITGDWYFTAEYLYNQKPEPPGTPSQFSLLQTNVALVHNHYGFLSVRYKINDLMNVSASAIADITAKSGLVTAQYSYNILENADLIAYMQGFPASTSGLLPTPHAEITYGVRIAVSF
jgi:hypothetical protein